MNEEIRLKLSPPWITYYNEIKALFGEDPAVKVDCEYAYDNNFVDINIKVDGEAKANAIIKLLPSHIFFGNIEVFVNIIPSNGELGHYSFRTTSAIFEKAFEGNPVFSFVKSVDYIFNNEIVYVVFKNRVVQFFNDNLNDIYGNVSTLYEDIARDLFDEFDGYGVYYCTDIETAIAGAPKNWP